MVRRTLTGFTAAIGALSAAACGGQSGSLPSSGEREPTYTTQAFGSRPVSAKIGVLAQSREAVLYSFDGRSGAFPVAAPTNVDGVLYGTTPSGGAHGKGAVFKITSSGTENVLHSFGGGKGGATPSAVLTNVNGVLYGTTEEGGGGCTDLIYGCGTDFRIKTSGAESVLHRFAGGSDGAIPSESLTYVNGVLYGTTSGGHPNGFGTVFKITMSGVETVLYRFAGGSDGAYPGGPLTEVNGVFYGTTGQGGPENYGTVFKITTSGTETVLHRFAGESEGEYPSTLTNVNGVLYGTTFYGGANGTLGGTVFEITTSGAETVLHSFGGGSDGAEPVAGLTNVDGVLYGTTSSGGANGEGTVFAITTSDAESVLYSFAGGSDGASPRWLDDPRQRALWHDSLRWCERPWHRLLVAPMKRLARKASDYGFAVVRHN